MNRKIAIPTTVGSPIMKMLARGRRLRGTALDPFGRTEMRRLERELITVFESSIDTVLGRIADGSMTVDEAARIAALPQTVRGFEERKIERAAAYRAELTTALG